MKNYTTTRRTENAFGNDDCLRQPLVFFIIRRGTFPCSVEDDASTKNQTPTTHYINTCVKLTIVTYLSFGERIAIANLYFCAVTRAAQIHSSILYCFSQLQVCRCCLKKNLNAPRPSEHPTQGEKCQNV